MRVLAVVNWLTLGGIEVQFLRALPWLRRSGIDVDVCRLGLGPPGRRVRRQRLPPLASPQDRRLLRHGPPLPKRARRPESTTPSIATWDTFRRHRAGAARAGVPIAVSIHIRHAHVAQSAARHAADRPAPRRVARLASPAHGPPRRRVRRPLLHKPRQLPSRLARRPGPIPRGPQRRGVSRCRSSPRPRPGGDWPGRQRYWSCFTWEVSAMRRTTPGCSRRSSTSCGSAPRRSSSWWATVRSAARSPGRRKRRDWPGACVSRASNGTCGRTTRRPTSSSSPRRWRDSATCWSRPRGRPAGGRLGHPAAPRIGGPGPGAVPLSASRRRVGRRDGALQQADAAQRRREPVGPGRGRARAKALLHRTLRRRLGDAVPRFGRRAQGSGFRVQGSGY